MIPSRVGIVSLIHWLVCSVSIYIIPRIVLCREDSAVTKTDKVPFLMEYRAWCGKIILLKKGKKHVSECNIIIIERKRLE